MKRTVIGASLTLYGTIWGLAIIIFTSNNMVSGWSTPPGRFLTTIAVTGMSLPFSAAFIFMLLGLIIMGIEYFKKQ